MALVPPQVIDALGVRGCCYLAALLTAQEKRRAVAPTRRHTIAVMGLLNELGVIDVPWPNDRWEVQPNAEETPLEKLQWRLACAAYRENTNLLSALEEFLENTPRDECSLTQRMDIWGELATTETEKFFEQQLVKHRFDPAWAQDITFVIRETHSVLSIAQWRYCAWAATRHGASIALQHSPTGDGVREAVHRELGRRAIRLASGHWGDCSFVPRNLVPESALGSVFTTKLAQLGARYWVSPPAAEVIASTDQMQSNKHVTT